MQAYVLNMGLQKTAAHINLYLLFWALWKTRIIHIDAFNQSKFEFKERLTGVCSSRWPPPTKEPFWKFLGKTSLPNLWSLSLFHEISVLFTVKLTLLREKLYVSLNKLQAIRPQGTIGIPFAWFSGSQPLVEFSFLESLSCSSFRLLTYLNYQITFIIIIKKNYLY